MLFIDNSEFSLNFIFKMTSIEPENNLTEYKKVPTSCLSIGSNRSIL
jgi:hypothetical protein